MHATITSLIPNSIPLSPLILPLFKKKFILLSIWIDSFIPNYVIISMSFAPKKLWRHYFSFKQVHRKWFLRSEDFSAPRCRWAFLLRKSLQIVLNSLFLGKNSDVTCYVNARSLSVSHSSSVCWVITLYLRCNYVVFTLQLRYVYIAICLI